jgi:hypothetical protein
MGKGGGLGQRRRGGEGENGRSPIGGDVSTSSRIIGRLLFLMGLAATFGWPTGVLHHESGVSRGNVSYFRPGYLVN